MCMVSLALAALIVNSIGNLRADIRIIHTEMIDIRKEVGDNRIEIINIRAEINDLRNDMDGLRIEMDRLRQGLLALTERVTGIEELVQRLFLPNQDRVARKEG